MDVQYSEAPKQNLRSTRRRSKNDPIFEMLQASPDSWVSIAAADLTGKTNTSKQGNILTAARHRGIRITTTHQDGRIYVRLVDSVEGAK